MIWRLRRQRHHVATGDGERGHRMQMLSLVLLILMVRTAPYGQYILCDPRWRHAHLRAASPALGYPFQGEAAGSSPLILTSCPKGGTRVPRGERGGRASGVLHTRPSPPPQAATTQRHRRPPTGRWELVPTTHTSTIPCHPFPFRQLPSSWITPQLRGGSMRGWCAVILAGPSWLAAVVPSRALFARCTVRTVP